METLVGDSLFGTGENFLIDKSAGGSGRIDMWNLELPPSDPLCSQIPLLVLSGSYGYAEFCPQFSQPERQWFPVGALCILHNADLCPTLWEKP